MQIVPVGISSAIAHVKAGRAKALAPDHRKAFEGTARRADTGGALARCIVHARHEWGLGFNRYVGWGLPPPVGARCAVFGRLAGPLQHSRRVARDPLRPVLW
jgi:hypothetical protein